MFIIKSHTIVECLARRPTPRITRISPPPVVPPAISSGSAILRLTSPFLAVVHAHPLIPRITRIFPPPAVLRAISSGSRIPRPISLFLAVAAGAVRRAVRLAATERILMTPSSPEQTPWRWRRKHGVDRSPFVSLYVLDLAVERRRNNPFRRPSGAP